MPLPEDLITKLEGERNCGAVLRPHDFPRLTTPRPGLILDYSAAYIGGIPWKRGTIQKGRAYRPVLEQLLRDEVGGKLGIFAEYRIGNETTLPGSAAAALLN